MFFIPYRGFTATRFGLVETVLLAEQLLGPFPTCLVNNTT